MNVPLGPLSGHADLAVHLVRLADFDQNKVTPGLLGFLIFAALGGASWLLVKNMNKQFKRINFEESPAPSPASPAPVAPGGGGDDAGK